MFRKNDQLILDEEDIDLITSLLERGANDAEAWWWQGDLRESLDEMRAPYEKMIDEINLAWLGDRSAG